eukprot:CAMPEP_0197926678 /NCGR_PEP_ID=MMETSP1439-20131203/99514_1 /TAXON_ID=66791 /ORGANISM="Gonyaulax spinifera, Strain CCMP409" /LENGTH=143 /DNA_ID=CAMNT_0043549219 /DNA_START=28 /DNA_END=454 /DNA_ORIENTATION=-
MCSAAGCCMRPGVAPDSLLSESGGAAKVSASKSLVLACDAGVLECVRALPAGGGEAQPLRAAGHRWLLGVRGRGQLLLLMVALGRGGGEAGASVEPAGARTRVEARRVCQGPRLLVGYADLYWSLPLEVAAVLHTLVVGRGAL